MNNQNQQTNNQDKRLTESFVSAGSLSSSDRRSNNTPQGGAAQLSNWEERSEGSVSGDNRSSQANAPNASRRRRRRDRRERHHVKCVLESYGRAPLDTLTVRNKKKLAWALRQTSKSSIKIGNLNAVSEGQQSAKKSPTEAERSGGGSESVPRKESTPESSRPADLTFAVIDKSQDDGRISLENWTQVEFSLTANYLTFVERHKGPAPTGFDEGWHQGRVKLMSFKDKRSANLYKTAIRQLGEVWKGAQLDVVSISEIPCRPSARTRLPRHPSNPEEIYTIIRRCNPELPTENWTIAELGEPEGKYRSAVITINKESLKPLAELKGKIHYGFGTINLIICKKDEKVPEKQISSPSTCPSTTPASSALPSVSAKDKDERTTLETPSSSTSSSSKKGRWLPFKSSCETRTSKDETRPSKDEKRMSKDETRAFKDETRTSMDETRTSKDQTRTSKDQTRTSKDEVRACKDETRTSKDETRTSKDETRTSKGRQRRSRERSRDSVETTRSADYQPYTTNRATPARRFPRSSYDSYDRMADYLNIQSEYTSLAYNPLKAALIYGSRHSELYPYATDAESHIYRDPSSHAANRMDMSQYGSYPWYRYM